ncbi:imidazole glycerol phosphate synthase subunit HisH [Nitrobacteraceae bacterium UC4446_H13]
MIGIVDYDAGNVASIANMIARVGGKAVITRDHDVLRKATKIVLPGVGAFDTAITNLHSFGLHDLLNELVLAQRKPVLGVCLGAQIIGKGSEEGRLPGFGWLDFELIRFRAPEGGKLRVPHMGWNTVELKRESSIFSNVPEPMRFYFVHSYYMAARDSSITLATTRYGNEFTSVAGKDNVIAMQFHPEKSHKYGMAIYRHFVERFVEC